MRQVFVECWSGGKLIKTYDFGVPDAILPGKPPGPDALVGEAKTMLTNDRLAFPPYDGITFKVRWSSN